MTLIDGSLRSTLACLAAIGDPVRRLNIFTGAIIANGGTIVLPPDGGGSWGPLLVEFSLMGILGTGETPAEALAEWIKCATRVVAAECAVTGLTGSPDDLHDACLMVRTRSQNAAAIEQARRLQQALALGLH